MSSENDIVSYIQKLKNMADYLARGNVLIAPDREYAIEIMDDETVKERNAFSIQEYSIYDELELTCYGEQKSIGVLMECLGNGEYESQVEGKIDFDIPYTPKEQNAEFYQRVMKRVNVVLKRMALSLAFGKPIPIDLESVKGNEEGMYTDWQIGNFSYSAQEEKFYLRGADGNILQEDVSIHVVMNYYNALLVEKERALLKKKIKEEARRQREEEGRIGGEEKE